MNCRYAAALATVGWYLMLPPLPPFNDTTADTNAPLPGWKIATAWDSAHECQEKEKMLIDTGSHMPTNNGMRDAFLSAQCIATDDPRLAK